MMRSPLELASRASCRYFSYTWLAEPRIFTSGPDGIEGAVGIEPAAIAAAAAAAAAAIATIVAACGRLCESVSLMILSFARLACSCAKSARQPARPIRFALSPLPGGGFLSRRLVLRLRLPRPAGGIIPDPCNPNLAESPAFSKEILRLYARRRSGERPTDRVRSVKFQGPGTKFPWPAPAQSRFPAGHARPA